MKRQALWWLGGVCAIGFVAFMLSAAYQNARVLQTSANAQAIRTVIVDAGHGGFDGGAVAADGTLEKEINLAIAERLSALLKCAGVQTVMTRTTDDSIHDPDRTSVRQQKISDIRNRLKIMEQMNNAVFVSIHQNHFTKAKYRGTQVFYSGNNAHSEQLARSIQDAVVSAIQPDNTRSVKMSGTEIYLLYHAMCPAVMVECGFLSNPEETDDLKSPDYQTRMALAVMQGILHFLDSTEEV